MIGDLDLALRSQGAVIKSVGCLLILGKKYYALV